MGGILPPIRFRPFLGRGKFSALPAAEVPRATDGRDVVLTPPRPENRYNPNGAVSSRSVLGLFPVRFWSASRSASLTVNGASVRFLSVPGKGFSCDLVDLISLVRALYPLHSALDTDALFVSPMAPPIGPRGARP